MVFKSLKEGDRIQLGTEVQASRKCHMDLRLAVSRSEELAMELRFDAIFYYVSDLDRAIQFYRDALGFTLHSRDYVARFYIGNELFELVPAPESSIGGRGNARLCLQADDITAAIGELRAKGVEVGNVETKQNGLLVSFHDADGNEICLWQYT